MKKLKVAFLFSISLILLIPIYLMIINSFSEMSIMQLGRSAFVPLEMSIKNYVTIFTDRWFLTWTWNTIWTTIATIVAAVLINCSAGYAFAYGKFKGQQIIFWVLMSPMFVTGLILIISRYVIFSTLKMTGYTAVIMAQLFAVEGIFLSRNYFSTIPNSYLETARLDGASEWHILMNVVLPLSKPLLALLILTTGFMALGNFLWQMLELPQQEQKTLIVGLVQTTFATVAIQKGGLAYNLAVGVVLLIPYLLIFSTSSRYFLESSKIVAEVEK